MEIQHLMWKLEELAAGFREALYDKGDVDAALGFLTEDCALTNVPTGTGGTGTDALRRYLDDVVAHRPTTWRSEGCRRRSTSAGWPRSRW